jgi:hypothetical protein
MVTTKDVHFCSELVLSRRGRKGVCGYLDSRSYGLWPLQKARPAPLQTGKLDVTYRKAPTEREKQAVPMALPLVDADDGAGQGWRGGRPKKDGLSEAPDKVTTRSKSVTAMLHHLRRLPICFGQTAAMIRLCEPPPRAKCESAQSVPTV